MEINFTSKLVHSITLLTAYQNIFKIKYDKKYLSKSSFG